MRPEFRVEGTDKVSVGCAFDALYIHTGESTGHPASDGPALPMSASVVAGSTRVMVITTWT